LIKFLPYKQTPACPLSTLSCLLLSSQRSERRSRKGATIGSLLDPLHCQFSLLTLSVEGLHSSLFTPLLVAALVFLSPEHKLPCSERKFGIRISGPNPEPLRTRILVPHFGTTFWSHIFPHFGPTLIHNYTTTRLPLLSHTTPPPPLLLPTTTTI
jgi:hypothetical protein